MKISFASNKLIPGQALRYIGRTFQGFVKEQPYMLFVGKLNPNRILVTYNSIKLSVSRLDVQEVHYS